MNVDQKKAAAIAPHAQACPAAASKKKTHAEAASGYGAVFKGATAKTGFSSLPRPGKEIDLSKAVRSVATSAAPGTEKAAPDAKAGTAKAAPKTKADAQKDIDPKDKKPDGQVWQGPGVYKIKANDVYLRTHELGLVSGLVKKGDEFVALDHKKGWLFGYARGDADKLGWIPVGSSQVTPGKHRRPKGVEGTTKANLTPSRALTDAEKQRFADDPMRRQNKKIEYVTSAESQKKGTEYSFPTTVKAGGVQLHENYSKDEGPSGELLKLDPRTEIGVRYVIDDKWVVVQLKSTNAPDGKARWAIADASQLDFEDKKDAQRLWKGKVPDSIR